MDNGKLIDVIAVAAIVLVAACIGASFLLRGDSDGDAGYKVKFDVNGGDPIGDMDFTKTTDTFDLPVPIRNGYEFMGWYGNADLTGDRIIQIAKGTERDVTVYAKWRLVLINMAPTAAQIAACDDIRIQFDSGAGDAAKVISAEARDALTAGKTLVIEDTVANVTWTFTGSDSKLAGYADQPFDTKVSADLNTEERSLTLDFGYDGTLPYTSVMRCYFGKDFAGQTVTVSCDDDRDPLTPDAVLGTYTVDADGFVEFPLDCGSVWHISFIYAVTFDYNGGTCDGQPSSTIEVAWGRTVGALPEPLLTGHTFTGWDPAVTAGTTVTSNMTLVAQWDVNTYTISFETTGGTPIEPIQFDYGAPIVMPADPVKEGNTFLGWDAEIPGTMPDHDIVLTASWSVNTYTITFVTGGGTEIPPIVQQYDTLITAPADPTKEGHTFAGWDAPVPERMPADDMTITAIWTVNTYTATVNLDGGSVVQTPDGWTEGAGVYTKDFAFGTPKEDITADFGSDAEKTGFTLAGFDATSVTMGTSGMTLTAQWEVAYHTVTLDLGGGTITDPIANMPNGWVWENEVYSRTVEYGTPLSSVMTGVPDPVAPIGLAFAGWDPDSGDVVCDMTVRALYDDVTYEIRFDADGGNAPNPHSEFRKIGGAPIGKPLYDGVKPGYTSGSNQWIFAKGGGFAFDGNSMTLTYEIVRDHAEDSVILLKFNWVPVTYTVHFDLSGVDGTVTESINATFGQVAHLPVPSATSPVTVFSGWNTADDGSGHTYSGAVTVDEDFIEFASGWAITLYALWAYGGDVYTVSFGLNGGSGPAIDSQEACEGGWVILPAPSGAPEGRYFSGWNTAEDGTGTHYRFNVCVDDGFISFADGTGTITLYAEWADNYYTASVGDTFFVSSTRYLDGEIEQESLLKRVVVYADSEGYICEGFVFIDGQWSSTGFESEPTPQGTVFMNPWEDMLSEFFAEGLHFVAGDPVPFEYTLNGATENIDLIPYRCDSYVSGYEGYMIIQLSADGRFFMMDTAFYDSGHYFRTVECITGMQMGDSNGYVPADHQVEYILFNGSTTTVIQDSSAYAAPEDIGFEPPYVGYVFRGWSVVVDGGNIMGNPIAPGAAVIGPHTVVAIWGRD